MVTEERLPALLWGRSIGCRRPRTVWNSIQSRGNADLRLLENTQIVSPHRKTISTLAMDATEDRFLLAGSGDATLSIFDLSKWGRETQLTNDDADVDDSHLCKQLYKPVAQSLRNPTNGHGASIVKAEWYAFDTGAFVSASCDGSLLVWDTHAMQSVVRWQPFNSISCLHLSKSDGRSESLLAVGSLDDAMIKLVDLRSGAASHSFLGHARGITSVQWCPTCDVIFASGSLDGTVRLWDIRHAGSRANLTTLDREQSSPYPLRPFRPDYRHLRVKSKVGPNSYNQDESISSHSGPVKAISFTPDGHHIVSCGIKQLHLWDLRSRGHLVTRQFAGSIMRSPMCVVNNHIWMADSTTKITAHTLDKGGLSVQTLDGHLGQVTALDHSRDSMQLISGGADGMILVWGSGSFYSNQESDRKMMIQPAFMPKRRKVSSHPT